LSELQAKRARPEVNRANRNGIDVRSMDDPF
jgi:hypothetical protein